MQEESLGKDVDAGKSVDVTDLNLTRLSALFTAACPGEVYMGRLLCDGNSDWIVVFQSKCLMGTQNHKITVWLRLEEKSGGQLL